MKPSHLARLIMPICHCALALLAGCSQPRPVGPAPLDSPPPVRGNTQASGTVSLSPVSRVGERVRTRKTQTVQETIRGVSVTSRWEETYSQETLLVDGLGMPLHVRRTYERQVMTVTPAGGQTAESPGPLEGCEIELVQRDSGVTVKVVSGKPPQGALQGLLISGLDVALLPVQGVNVGQRWDIDVNARPALAGFLSAMGISADKNELSARLIDLKGAIARVPVDWRVSGKLKDSSVPVSLAVAGELVVDTSTGLTREVRLLGGTRDSGGVTLRQLSFELTREPVAAWYK